MAPSSTAEVTSSLTLVRLIVLAWTVLLVAGFAAVAAMAGHVRSIAPLALGLLFCWQALFATPKVLWPRGAR